MNLTPLARLALGHGSAPTTGLRGAIVCYVDGVPWFADELELRTDAEQDRFLDVYCNDLGLSQICLGPGYALVYDHHDLPPIDWTQQNVLPLARKLKARGLHITLAGLPDVAPYWDGTTWNFALLSQNLRPIYQQLADERLIGSVRMAWEMIAASAVLCEGVRWLRTIFTYDIPVLWHNPPTGHLNPCLTSEGEGRWSWDALLAAGASGLDLQSSPPYSRPDAMQAMLYDLWDMRRRATGTQGSPWGGPLLTTQGQPMTVRNAEYAAYDLFHNRLPWSTAQAYGAAGMTVAGPGQDTALDGI